jgi:hypothetical protein
MVILHMMGMADARKQPCILPSLIQGIQTTIGGSSDFAYNRH